MTIFAARLNSEYLQNPRTQRRWVYDNALSLPIDLSDPEALYEHSERLSDAIEMLHNLDLAWTHSRLKWLWLMEYQLEQITAYLIDSGDSARFPHLWFRWYGFFGESKCVVLRLPYGHHFAD